MRYTKWIAVVLCVVLLVALAAFYIAPNKVNEVKEVNNGGFGPKIKGLQLGQKMSLMEIVSWGAAHRWTPPILWFIDEVEFRSSKSILCTVYCERQIAGQSKDFSVKTANGPYATLENFSGTLEDLLSEIEKLDFKGVILLGGYLGIMGELRLAHDDMRIKYMSFSKYNFGAEAMTPKEFAQAFVNAYNIPGLESVGKNKWQHRNLSQGWQVNVNDSGVEVSLIPIVTQSKFD